MAVAPTGAMYKSLVFDGESSRDYGIYITGQAVYNAPERDVEMINIPGRNGSLALDKGRFQNIEVTYPAGIFADNEADFAQGISDFRNFLCSRNGYVRLTDDYNPNEYRMAVYKSGLEVSPTQLKAGEFDIVFGCKPQRFLTSGEEPVTIGEWRDTETASGEIASFEAKEGDAVKSLIADINPIQSLNGYDKPWAGGAGKNKLNCLVASIKSGNTGGTWSGNDYTFRGVTYTLNSADGTVVDSIKVVGTASGGNAYLVVGFGNVADSLSLVSGTQYIISNGASVGTVSYNDGSSSHSGNQSYTFTWSDNSNARFTVGVASGATVNTVYYPMIRLSSVSDATYEPYANVCPISGWDSVKATRTGKNIIGIIGEAVNASGVIITAPSATRTEIIPVEAGDVVYGKRSTALASGNNMMMRLYDANKTFLNSRTLVSYTDTSGSYTVASDVAYIACTQYFSENATTALLENKKVSVTVNENVPYEPYQGNTYSIDLNGTRYGGTLDVVSGVLTVDRAIVDLGDFTWSSFHSPATDYFYSNALSDYKYIDSDTINYLCSAYESISGNQQRTNGTLRIASTKSITIQDLNYASASAFKTAVTGQTLCYEITNPTTVQLTAQAVELLTGLNQVWANSGDVEVEYGTAPNVVYNPTLFESSPMLEVKGNGNIVIGEDTITVEDELIGEIPLTDGAKSTTSVTLNTANLNSDDSIYTYASPRLEFKLVYGSGKIEAELTTISGGTGTNYTKSTGGVINIVLNISNLSFVYGTSASQSVTAGYRVILNNSTTTTATFTFTATYNGSTRVTLSWNASGLPSGVTRKLVEWIHPVYYGSSSKSAAPMPLYIDLDIGEAWGELGGEMVNLNNIVSLPASLPKLAVGDTEITYSNTITDLKLIPRWWKI